MQFLIFYFSGTGNTWWVVDKFRQFAENDHHTVNMLAIERSATFDWKKVKQQWIDADYVGFAHPIYCSDVPTIMKEFCTSLHLQLTLPDLCEKKGFVFTTMDLFSGDGAMILQRYLLYCKVSMQLTHNFQMTSNIGAPIFNYNPVNLIRFEKRKMRTYRKIREVYTKLIQGEQSLQKGIGFGQFFGGFQRLFMSSVEKKIIVLGVDVSRCSKCQLCVNNCPTKAITYRMGEFEFDDSCTSCFRCYNFCPNLAITMRGKSANPKRHRQHQAFIKSKFF